MESSKLCKYCWNQYMSNYDHISDELQEFCDVCGYYKYVSIKNKREDGIYEEDWQPEYNILEGQTGYVLKIFQKEGGYSTGCIDVKDVKNTVTSLKANNDVLKFAMTFKGTDDIYQTQIYKLEDAFKPTKPITNTTKLKMKEYAVIVDGQTPSLKYTDYNEAEGQAKRLAVKERKTAYVLVVVAKIELSEVKITRFDS